MEIKDEWSIPGIYVIEFPSGAQYVGMSRRSVRDRLYHHLAIAKNGSALAVHCAIRKYDREAITVEVVSQLDGDLLPQMEKQMIAERRARGVRLYNMTEGGEGKPGFRVSEETKRKIGLANSAPERKQARAAALRTEAVKRRMSAGQRASWTQERRARFSERKRGEGAYQAKITEADVRVIRQRLSNGDSCAAISRTYGVTPEAISAIKHRKNWAHVA